jgi:hypothetical protein
LFNPVPTSDLSIQIWPIPASRSANASSTVPTIAIPDARSPINGSSGEGAEHIDDRHRARRTRRAVEKAVDRDFHNRGDEAKSFPRLRRPLRTLGAQVWIAGFPLKQGCKLVHLRGAD